MRWPGTRQGKKEPGQAATDPAPWELHGTCGNVVPVATQAMDSQPCGSPTSAIFLSYTSMNESTSTRRASGSSTESA